MLDAWTSVRSCVTTYFFLRTTSSWRLRVLASWRRGVWASRCLVVRRTAVSTVRSQRTTMASNARQRHETMIVWDGTSTPHSENSHSAVLACVELQTNWRWVRFIKIKLFVQVFIVTTFRFPLAKCTKIWASPSASPQR